MSDILGTPICVIGAGSWGTALALVLANNKQTVHLWGHHEEHIQKLAATRTNDKYLPNIHFPNNLLPKIKLSDALLNAQDILIAVPSHAFRSTIELLKPHLTASSRIIWATKGLDPKTSKLLHQVVEEILGKNIAYAVLSGPSFANEIAQGLPCAITIAANNTKFTKDLITRFHHQHFRVYTSHDLIGVQLGGAIKNILAIGAGISDGLKMGSSARASLLTRGLSEMMRLGIAMGGKQETLMGLSGLGDLILTCTDNQSRNRRFGLAIATGKSFDAASKEIGQVVEGIPTTAEVFRLAQQLKIEMPITEQVYEVLNKNLSPKEAVKHLLARVPKAEN